MMVFMTGDSNHMSPFKEDEGAAEWEALGCVGQICALFSFVVSSFSSSSSLLLKRSHDA